MGSLATQASTLLVQDAINRYNGLLRNIVKNRMYINYVYTFDRCIIFGLKMSHDWIFPRWVKTWENPSDIPRIFKTAPAAKIISRIINTIASIWHDNMLGYLSLDFCSSELTFFLELCLWKRQSVPFLEQIMSPSYIREYCLFGYCLCICYGLNLLLVQIFFVWSVSLIAK